MEHSTSTSNVAAVVDWRRLTAVLALAAALAAGCNNNDANDADKAGGGDTAGVAAAAATTAPAVTTFATPEEALQALIAGLRAGDKAALSKMFGPDADELLSSGDEVADRARREKFLAAYDAGHKLTPAGDGEWTVVVGAQDWPLPIPIVKDESGRWYFDTEAGKEELLNRQIGQNELDVIEVCGAIVDAQKEYASSNVTGDGVAEYARKFISDPGKRNGLYWQTADGEPASPLGPLVAEASEAGYTTTRTATGEPRPYHGYYYRMLTAQGPGAPGGAMDYVLNGRLIGGFAVVAYPAKYGNSGVMTFIVNHDGVVYQKDLGEETPTAAKAMDRFDPAGWKPAKAPEGEKPVTGTAP